MKKSKGITLIALVITIIVLLILAGITIVSLIGDNGILGRTEKARLVTEQKAILEELKLKAHEKVVNMRNDVSQIGYLKENGYIKEDITEGEKIFYVVEPSKLNPVPKTGKGNYTKGDVYYIFEGDLYYRDNKCDVSLIGEIFREGTAGENIPKEKGIQILVADTGSRPISETIVAIYSDENTTDLIDRVTIGEEGYYKKAEEVPQCKENYYVVVEEVPHGYDKPDQVIEHEVNECPCIIELYENALLPSTASGVYTSGNTVNEKGKVVISFKANMKWFFESTELPSENLSMKYLIEPLAEYDKNTGKYVYRNELSKHSIELIEDTISSIKGGINNIEEGALRTYIDGYLPDTSVDGVDRSSASIEYDLKLNSDNDYSYVVTGNSKDEPLTISNIERNKIYLIKTPLIYGDNRIYALGTILIIPRMYRDIDGNFRDTINVVFAPETRRKEEKIKITTNISELGKNNTIPVVIYEVISKKKGEIIYSDIISASITEPKKVEDFLENVPVGDEISVKIKYCSPDYRCTSSESIILNATNNYAAEFTIEKNDETNKFKTAIAIQNLFEYSDENGEWSWDMQSNETKNCVGAALNQRFSNWEFISNITLDQDGWYFINTDKLPQKPVEELEEGENAYTLPNVYIKLKLIVPTGIDVTYSDTEQRWYLNNDWYYFSDFLQEGETTTELGMIINNIEERAKEFHAITILEVTSEIEDKYLEDAYRK